MKPRWSYTRKKALELLNLADIDKPSVPVKRLAKLVGAHLVLEPYDGDVSGMLLRQNGKVIIGINESDKLERQRFTIAHEIGHLLLHEKESFHIDTSHPLRFRNKDSSSGEYVAEVEANRFAAELLMPREFIEASVRSYSHLDIDDAIEALAKLYEVSQQAMTIRLTALGCIS